MMPMVELAMPLVPHLQRDSVLFGLTRIRSPIVALLRIDVDWF